MNCPKRRMRAAAPSKSANPSAEIKNFASAQVIYICEKCGSVTKTTPRKFEGFGEEVREFLEEADYAE